MISVGVRASRTIGPQTNRRDRVWPIVSNSHDSRGGRPQTRGRPCAGRGSSPASCRQEDRNLLGLSGLREKEVTDHETSFLAPSSLMRENTLEPAPGINCAVKIQEPKRRLPEVVDPSRASAIRTTGTAGRSSAPSVRRRLPAKKSSARLIGPATILGGARHTISRVKVMLRREIVP